MIGTSIAEIIPDVTKLSYKYLTAGNCSKSVSIKRERRLKVNRKTLILILSLFLVVGFSSWSLAAKVPAPEKGGDGFTAISLEEAKKLHENGATIVACHSHTTDFMKGHPSGTVHITCLVPKDHKRTDMPLSEVDFDITQLPKDKDTPIVTYCASNT
jgi:rhodanese-related sulfurtransferase